MGAVNTTYTFTATDTITSSKMNNIIDQTTMTSDAILGTTLEVASGQLKVRSQGITANELATGAVTANSISAGAVTSSNILDGTILNADINAAAAIDPSKLGSGAFPAGATVTTSNIVDASITAPKLNGAQTGTAPIYGARAWCAFDAGRNSTGGLDFANTNRYLYASGNIASVLKTGTGLFTVTMTTALPSTAYVVVGGVYDSGTIINGFASIPSSHTTTQFNLLIEATGGSPANLSNNSLLVFG